MLIKNFCRPQNYQQSLAYSIKKFLNSAGINPQKDYYKELGVTKNASKKDIKKAFVVLTKKHHPDNNKGNDKKFKEITEAYTCLSNDEKKKEYELLRSVGGHSGGQDYTDNPFSEGKTSGSKTAYRYYTSKNSNYDPFKNYNSQAGGGPFNYYEYKPGPGSRSSGTNAGRDQFEETFNEFVRGVKETMEKDFRNKDQQRREERDPYSKKSSSKSQQHYTSSYNYSGDTANEYQKFYKDAHNSWNTNGQRQNYQYKPPHDEKFEENIFGRKYKPGESTRRPSSEQSKDSYWHSEEDTWKHTAPKSQKYEYEFKKAKRDEEIRRTEEYEALQRKKEEKFFNEMQDKLDRGREKLDQFKDDINSKGWSTTMKSWLGLKS